MMRNIISGLIILSTSFLSGCVAQTYYGPGYNTTYVYAGSNDLYSNRVDYLGYGLGGQGLGGYGVGGYGLVGYGTQVHDSLN